eukprot:4955588-Alexandrium_andersonii.AAC.1
MQDQLIEYMERTGLAVMVLQEAGTPITTQFQVQKCQFVQFGSGRKVAHAGVGFIFRLDLRPATKYAWSKRSRRAVRAVDAAPRGGL